MKLQHNSRNIRYRKPFGAVPTGSSVYLALEVSETDINAVEVDLRIWVDGEGETILPLQREECTTNNAALFSGLLPCPAPNIMWYSFIVRTPDVWAFVGSSEEAVGGTSVTYYEPQPPSFQITVYEPRECWPEWYTRGLVYQIFPDRYKRGAGWREQAHAALSTPRAGVPRQLIENWDTPPSYTRSEDNTIAVWDFYGGTLSGIEEDLPRLEEMGVTTIYLNPIFEAASNHRYDIGNYFAIDPLLGTTESFRSLCATAKKHGIHIILDGVFNHVGSDSVYFNALGNYPELGAWQAHTNGQASPWADAFTFNEDDTYDCWWGVTDMPCFKKDAPAVRELLLGDTGVVHTWLDAGASGWRLDVADELTDELIEKIRAEILATKPDGLLLGEVWEDASHKISYGTLRRYLLGSELDGAMNYPFRGAVLDYLTSKTNAATCAEILESLRENYPPQALRANLNLLGSHDQPRLLSVLGGAKNIERMTEAERGAFSLEGRDLNLAKGRFWLAALFQACSLGTPSIYYGDEAGIQGLTDPYNRAPYPWGHEDNDTQTMYRNAFALRRALPVFTEGDMRTRALNDDVIAFDRGTWQNGTATNSGGALTNPEVTVLLNRSYAESHTLTLPVHATAFDLVGGHTLRPDEQGKAQLTLYPFGSAVLYYPPAERIVAPLGNGVGVVCHITSLPTADGKPGYIGAPTHTFIDQLACAGVSWWQILPITPTDAFGSPYAGPSAFAGNVNLLGKTPYELRSEFNAFVASASAEQQAQFATWRQKEASWLNAFSAYYALKGAHNQTPWFTWEPEFRHYSPELLTNPAFAPEAEFCAWCQWQFWLAWKDTLAYAHKRGIHIIGDIPFYVSADSADAWANPQYFSITEAGTLTEEAGCPPDPFSADGQRWGNPTYNWKAMKASGYTWWINRLGRSFELYDFVRLDHFLGFANYYGIAEGQTAKEGTWHPGPGYDLFENAYHTLGPLPLIAEDLGYLTPAVRALRTRCGFPGMDVLAFADYDVREALYPHAEALMYTSTHDTSTLVGWCAEYFCNGNEAEAAEVATDILQRAFTSEACGVIVQLQDVALLGDNARMNTPATTENNWSWQASAEDVATAMETLRGLQQFRQNNMRH